MRTSENVCVSSIRIIVWYQPYTLSVAFHDFLDRGKNVLGARI